MPTIAELASSLRSGAVTATALAEEFLAREEATRDALHSFVLVDADRLLQDAADADRALSAGDDRGPLHGIPVGIKDIIDVAGMPTRCGSPLYPDAPMATDAEVVRRLRAAGAVIAGKTATHELACGVVTAPVSNPRGLDRVPGGSSGGSGAAVAAGLVPVALGSDTGGSIRIPAALCGVAGIKPTYGLVPLTGVEPLSVSLDHLGPLGATVEDCALALTALTGGTEDYAGRVHDGVAGMRLGVLVDEPFAPMQPAVESAFVAAVDTMRSLGAECLTVSIPELAHTLAAEFGIIPLDAFTYHAASVRDRPDDIDPGIRALFVAGAALPPSVFRRASAARVVIARAIARCMDELGLHGLLSPTLPATAARKTDSVHVYGDHSEPIDASYVRTTAPFNLSGQPAVSVPCGEDADGLPVGLQVATRAGEDALALRIAAAYGATRP